MFRQDSTFKYVGGVFKERRCVRGFHFFRNLAENSTSTQNSDKLFFLGQEPKTPVQSSNNILWPYSCLGHTTYFRHAIYSEKDTPAKDSAIPRDKDFVLTIQIMQSNEYSIPQSKSSGRNVKYSSAPHQVSLDPVGTGAAYGIPRTTVFCCLVF